MHKIYFYKISLLAAISLIASPAVIAEPDDNSELKISGVVVIDAGVVSKDLIEDDPSVDVYLRKLKLSFESQFSKDWEAGLTIEFDDSGEVELDDYSIEYDGFEYIKVKAGKADLVLGLQNSSSSKVNGALEKDMASSALMPRGDFGLGGAFNQKQFSGFLNIFESSKDFDTGNNTYGVSTRLVYQVSKQYHFGFNASVLNYGGQNFQIQQSAEMKMSGDIIESELFRANSMNFISVEYAQRLKSINIQSEWSWLNVIADQSFNPEQQDAKHDGGYIQLSYFLNAKSNKFKKGGYAKRTDSNNTIELVSRYSQLNVQNQLDTLQQESFLLGANLYVNDNVRLMANLIFVKEFGLGGVARAQISF